MWRQFAYSSLIYLYWIELIRPPGNVLSPWQFRRLEAFVNTFGEERVFLWIKSRKGRNHKGWVPGTSWRQEERITGTADNQRNHKEGWQAKDSWRKIRASQQEHEREGNGAVNCVAKTSSSEQKPGIGGLSSVGNWEEKMPTINYIVLTIDIRQALF